MIKSILTQTKIMLNKKGFMFGFSAMMMICLLEVVFIRCYRPTNGRRRLSRERPIVGHNLL